MRSWIGVALGIAAGLLYLYVGFPKAGTDSHYLFAQAFLDGRLYIEGSYPWLELVPRAEGGWYTPFPPLLSTALIPFAAAGIEVDTNVISAVMGGISVALVWAMLGRLEVADRPRLALTVAWGIGSELLWVAGEGGQHLAPQVTAAALLLASLTLGIGRQWPLLAGLLLGLAALARLPVGLALPLLLWLYRPADRQWRGLGQQPWVRLLAGLLVPALLAGAYNRARFGSTFEFGYGLIRNEQGVSVLDEPWYDQGIVSLAYLPNGLREMLLRGLEFSDEFPWVSGSIMGASILLTMPILWWVFEARGRLAAAAAISVVLVMLPNLLHGNPGFAQLGYRYIVDALPILWLLLGLAFLRSLPRAATVALAAGIAVNLWLSAVFWAEVIP
jgi:hypothetical protein